MKYSYPTTTFNERTKTIRTIVNLIKFSIVWIRISLKLKNFIFSPFFMIIFQFSLWSFFNEKLVSVKKRENVTVEIILTIGSYLEETVFCEKGRRKETGGREKRKEGERWKEEVRETNNHVFELIQLQFCNRLTEDWPGLDLPKRSFLLSIFSLSLSLWNRRKGATTMGLKMVVQQLNTTIQHCFMLWKFFLNLSQSNDWKGRQFSFFFNKVMLDLHEIPLPSRIVFFLEE